MDTQIDSASPRSARSSTDRMLVHRTDEMMPIRDLPAAIGLALEKNALRDSLVAIGLGFPANEDPQVHVLVQPAAEQDAVLAFRSDVVYLGGVSPFGEMINQEHLGERVRAVRLVGARPPKAEVPHTVAQALRSLLLTHGPAFMEATRGFLSAPTKGSALWMLISGQTVGPITLHRDEIEQIQGDIIPCLGWINSVRAVAAVGDNRHLAVINCGRDHTYTPYDRDHRALRCAPAPRLKRPSRTFDMGGPIQSISTALWPGKTSGQRIPQTWYHLVGMMEGRTYLVRVSGSPDGFSFAVVGNTVRSFQILEAATPGSFVTRDAASGAVRMIQIPSPFGNNAEANKLFDSF